MQAYLNTLKRLWGIVSPIPGELLKTWRDSGPPAGDETEAGATGIGIAGDPPPTGYRPWRFVSPFPPPYC